METKVIVTTSWDDGHKLDIKLSGLLRQYSLQGTIYYAPHNREWNEDELLSLDEVINISHEFEIGGHTMTHPDLTKVSIEKAKNEIEDSRLFLQDLLQTEVNSFCYPKGRFNVSIKKAVQESGYKNARTVERFCFGIKDKFAAGTSVNTYQHYQDILRVWQFSDWNISKAIRSWDWGELAKQMFDYVLENGGVFHLWGHSWEIEENNDWERLEEVFEYISRRKDVKYLNFSDAVEESESK